MAVFRLCSILVVGNGVLCKEVDRLVGGCRPLQNQLFYGASEKRVFYGASEKRVSPESS